MPTHAHGRPSPLGENLQARVSTDDRATVVRLHGEVELTSVSSLRERVLGLAVDGHVNQVLDLSEVTFLDSAGLGALVSIHRRLRTLRGALALVCTNEQILRLLRLTSMDRVIHVYPTVDEALDGEFSA